MLKTNSNISFPLLCLRRIPWIHLKHRQGKADLEFTLCITKGKLILEFTLCIDKGKFMLFYNNLHFESVDRPSMTLTFFILIISFETDRPFIGTQPLQEWCLWGPLQKMPVFIQWGNQILKISGFIFILYPNHSCF
jgi:hypothetical protein